LEVRLRRKIRELHENLEETDSLKKEAESALHDQWEYYERNQHERDATSEKVDVALYGMLNKLHKQLQERDRAATQNEATLCRRCKELRFSRAKACFERDRTITQMKEREKKVREECHDGNCGNQPLLHN
jgi:hypothetical protein